MQTVRAFHETGRLFPQRAWAGAWAGTIKWGKLIHARVAQALKNLTYAGVYTFGKTRDVRRFLPDGTVRSTRRRRAREEWAVLIQDHHDGYILWRDFLVTATVDTVDDAVASLLLKTMTPQQIQVALTAADEVADRQVRTHRAAELAVERARYEADRAFAAVEPENRLVARTLESRWEARLATLAEAEVALTTARAVKPALPDHDALQAQAADLPRLWDAPSTSPRDRKRLLRMLIADVTLLLEQDSDVVRIGVRWHTGAADELVVERRGPGRTPPEALAIVRQHGATHSNVEIAKMLNDAGLRTGKNLRFTPRHVAGVRGIHQIFTPRTMAVQDGEITASSRPRRTSVSRRTPSTTGFATARSLPTLAQVAGAFPGTPKPKRSTGRKSQHHSASSRSQPARMKAPSAISRA